MPTLRLWRNCTSHWMHWGALYTPNFAVLIEIYMQPKSKINPEVEISFLSPQELHCYTSVLCAKNLLPKIFLAFLYYMRTISFFWKCHYVNSLLLQNDGDFFCCSFAFQNFKCMLGFPLLLTFYASNSLLCFLVK